MYVHIFGYLVNKLEIWWVYLSPIEKKLLCPRSTIAINYIMLCCTCRIAMQIGMW